jgi:glycosyltransferase involved in cell wall biosynthesis
MKVLLVNIFYVPYVVGGAERFLQVLAESLVQAGHEVVVVSLGRGPTRVERLNGVKVYYIGVKVLPWPVDTRKKPNLLRPFWHILDTYNPWRARKAAEIIETERPDVVHTNNLWGFSVALWPLVKSRGLPLVHTLHDYYLMCPLMGMYHRGRNCPSQCFACRLYGSARRRFSGLCNAVVGVSEFVLRRHRQAGYFEGTPQARVIYNPTRLHAGERKDPPRGPLRLGFLGSVAPNKGIELLLQTLAGVPPAQWQLKVAGRGVPPYVDYLRRRYPMGNVEFLGFIEPEDFFQAIDVNVVPSLWHEPLGMTVLESYAHGVPVIGSRRGGIPEIIEDGRTGFLFEPENPQGLKEAVLRFIEDPGLASRMRDGVLAKATEYAPQKTAMEYLRIYKQVMVK